VLVEPEIPNNTGNIGRTCVATGCALHLVHPLGFDVSERACRRAGLDYWPRLDVRHHDSWPGYLASERPGAFWLLTTKARRSVFDISFSRGDALVFGKETAGLDGSILAAHADRCITLPMTPDERSLNLATVVCATVYEGVRQFISRGEVKLDVAGRMIAQGVPSNKHRTSI
jgi:tRNA (cytidine/uridine-2'-O-)-methyltransferase